VAQASKPKLLGLRAQGPRHAQPSQTQTHDPWTKAGGGSGARDLSPFRILHMVHI